MPKMVVTIIIAMIHLLTSHGLIIIVNYTKLINLLPVVNYFN